MLEEIKKDNQERKRNNRFHKRARYKSKIFISQKDNKNNIHNDNFLNNKILQKTTILTI